MKINLNNVFFTHKSSTCFSHDGNPLSVYSSYQDALESADYASINLVPYQCERCGLFHLKPEAFYCEKVIRKCNCVDSNGKAKATYKTKEDAVKMANIRKNFGNITVYLCPEGYGYHLTSHAY